MRKLGRYTAIAAAVLIVFAPARALAAVIVPPGNSGVNQYTQTYPTAGGNVAVEGRKPRQPKQVLGKQNARALEDQGPEGKAAADLAAASSPTETSTGTEKSGSGGRSGKSGGGRSHPRPSHGGSGDATQPLAASDGASSRLAQIVGQASGSTSSGNLGLLMPIILLAGLAWCIAYSRRRRRHPA